MSTGHTREAATESTESPQGYALWAIYRRDPQQRLSEDPSFDAAAETAELQRAQAEALANGVTLRGWYDVSGLRADADLMVWLHGPTAEGLQAELRRLRRTAALARLIPSWQALGVHRDAEFNRAHVPGFLRGEHAREWLCLYPFVRSTEWYLLPTAERSAMLAEHGRVGAAHRGVVANTVSAFALGDYEWLLPMEADELTELVDMMRDLRATDARRHMREEVPFYTGRRIAATEILEVIR
ncbi:chlorite dismutase family protein [Leucobacter insecticola]|uniref:Coproheme decarboxylase n=1 Tax=Leucobacter insecticola TaxID=2714934 RepID=A0A6G8FGV3_9MICO|nr:hydrogen peroxide-dependent heme synthase [Leucobacter insecticola]QIM15598.1 chlorite dismutase family protein [Leucobacter insecticola]